MNRALWDRSKKYLRIRKSNHQKLHGVQNKSEEIRNRLRGKRERREEGNPKKSQIYDYGYQILRDPRKIMVTFIASTGAR